MKLRVERSAWNEASAAWLALACDEFYPLPALQQDVESGLSALFNIMEEGGALIGAFVVRFDECAGVVELVVPVLGGKLSGDSLFSLITPFAEKIAAEGGADFLRAHTKRKGTARLLEKAGWQQSEIVFRKACNG